MKQRARALLVVCVAACTYNEYQNYYAAPVTSDPDASASGLGAGGAGAAGGSNGNVAGAGVAGQGGTALTGSAGAAGGDAGCTGCVRLGFLPGRVVEYQLELPSRRNLSNSIVRWRVRVRDYVDQVQVNIYVESGDHVSGQPIPEGVTTGAVLTTSSGWQDIGIDLSQLEAFRAPAFIDLDGGGGFAGGGFDPGQPFDKSRVERVGLRFNAFAQGGLLTPATLEVDAVTFSAVESLNVDFSADQGDCELVDPEAASLTHIPG